MERKYSNGQDPLVVPSVELAAVIATWIKNHDAKFVSSDPGSWELGRNSYNISGITAYEYLKFHTGFGHRTIYRILSGESKNTSLEIADAILTVIEEIGALHDGRITTIPNPQWSQERWIQWREDQGTCI